MGILPWVLLRIANFIDRRKHTFDILREVLQLQRSANGFIFSRSNAKAAHLAAKPDFVYDSVNKIYCFGDGIVS